MYSLSSLFCSFHISRASMLTTNWLNACTSLMLCLFPDIMSSLLFMTELKSPIKITPVVFVANLSVTVPRCLKKLHFAGSVLGAYAFATRIVL